MKGVQNPYNTKFHIKRTSIAPWQFNMDLNRYQRPYIRETVHSALNL